MFFCDVNGKQPHEILPQVSVQLRLNVELVLKTFQSLQNISHRDTFLSTGCQIVFCFFYIELDTCKVHEHWNYTLQRRRVLCEGNVEVLDEVLQ